MATSVILNCQSSTPSSSSSTKEQPSTTSGEILQTMLNDAMAKSIIKAGIKQEEDEDDIENNSNMFNLHSSSTPSPPFNSSIVSTSGIAHIPLESSRSSPDNEINYPSTSNGHTYVQLHRPRIRILHNLLSNKLTICRKPNFVQVNTIIDVPLIDEMCRGTAKTMTPPPISTSSSLLSSSKRSNPIPEFTSWLNDHLKQQGKDGEIKDNQPPSAFSSRRSSIFAQSISKDPKSLGHKKLPAWLLQLSQNASVPQPSNIVNNVRTVEIPFNESPTRTTDQSERKSQRLSDKIGESGTKTIDSRNKMETAVIKKTPISTPTTTQYKELKTELTRIRKQMCRDRLRFIDESKAIREEMQKMKEVVLLALETIQNQNINLNGKRKILDENDHIDEPSPKRSC